MSARVVGAGGDRFDGMAFFDGERLVGGEYGRFQLKHLAIRLPIRLHKMDHKINHQILFRASLVLQREVQVELVAQMQGSGETVKVCSSIWAEL